MTEQAIEVIVQGARERFPGHTPRIISDNGPQFIAEDFKEFVREAGMTHVRTSPYYPQSNGKIERWHQSIKRECLRPRSPVSLPDARNLVSRYVEDYNTVRPHSTLCYITPMDQMEGRIDLRQTRFYREVFAEGEARGEVKLLQKLLIRRFGVLPEWVGAKLARAEPAQLETWGERVLEAQSLEAVFVA